MSSDLTAPNVNALAARWWALAVRGAVAILFGILCIATPGLSLMALILFWGAYAIADGVLNLILAARRARVGWSWGWLLFEGAVSVVAGAATFAWPGITGLALLSVIAVWAVATGIAEIFAAIRLRRQITGEWLLAASGVLSILFGTVLMMFPGTGALALVWVIGAYAIAFGLLLVGLGLRLRRWGRSRERQIPTGGATTSA